jgi:hypothetical protein
MKADSARQRPTRRHTTEAPRRQQDDVPRLVPHDRSCRGHTGDVRALDRGRGGERSTPQRIPGPADDDRDRVATLSDLSGAVGSRGTPGPTTRILRHPTSGAAFGKIERYQPSGKAVRCPPMIALSSPRRRSSSDLVIGWAEKGPWLTSFLRLAGRSMAFQLDAAPRAIPRARKLHPRRKQSASQSSNS